MAPQTIDDVRSYVKAAGIPFIVKGVLSEQDAAKCPCCCHGAHLFGGPEVDRR